MTFWSSQKLEKNIKKLIDPPNIDAVDCNAVTLCVGKEIFITPHIDEINSQTKRILTVDEPFQIPPSQFAFILTEESVSVPEATMSFISMKATFKMQGLINVSGFHVDPGWEGPLIFAVYNAGPAPVHLQRGLPLFLIWYADLDGASKKRKTGTAKSTIPPKLIANLTNATDSLFALKQRVENETKTRQTEDQKLVEKIHKLEKSQERIKVISAVLLTIFVGLVAYGLRSELAKLVPYNDITQHEINSQETQPNLEQLEKVTLNLNRNDQLTEERTKLENSAADGN